MKNFPRVTAICASILLASSLPALASTTTFNFSFANSTESGFGQLTADSTTTPGQYLITGISGTAEGSTIAGLDAPGVYPNDGIPGDANDNLLFFPDTGAGLLDFSGVSFALANGSQVNVYFDTGAYFVDTNNDNSLDPGSFSVTVSETSAPTPEPGSLILAGTGLAGLCGAIRRRISR